MALLNVCCVVAGVRCPGDTLLRIFVPEALGGSYVGVVWPLVSGPASGPLLCYNEDFRF